MSKAEYPDRVERWGRFDLALEGPRHGNPYVDVQFGARFRLGHRNVEVGGFYDGDGTYRARHMPDMPGTWHFETYGNCPELDGATGEFTCVEPAAGNHGPVGVRRSYHFAYADGTPYRQVGTTCYAWVHQEVELQKQTLATLRTAPFNKLRMCVFPKDYDFNKNEPPLYPFERTAEGRDYTRFNPDFFRHLERRVGELMGLGIEADIILFHPYDRWGFARMGAEADDRYLRYIVARLAAYRNVWWSLANEFDIMESKSLSDWDRFFHIIQECDPYQHPRSIHNCREFYDHNKPWVTHQSIQRSDVEQTRTWRNLCRKPVVIDECCYEGDIPHSWGNIAAQELVRRFWEATVRGGYAGHGETYLHPQDILWWSKGGVLRGQSPERLAFLRQALEEGPAEGLDPIDGVIGHGHPCAGRAGEYYLAYFGVRQPGKVSLSLPEGGRYSGEILDTWEMTITPAAGPLEGRCTVTLPARPYIALRVRRVG